MTLVNKNINVIIIPTVEYIDSSMVIFNKYDYDDEYVAYIEGLCNDI